MGYTALLPSLEDTEKGSEPPAERRMITVVSKSGGP